MVDAINSFNPNTINWNKLTLKEIRQYEQEGAEVPAYIQEWRQYMELLNNIPDDITYDTYVNKPDFLSDDSSKDLMHSSITGDTYSTLQSITGQLDAVMEEVDREAEDASDTKDGIMDRIQLLQERANQLKNDKKDPLAPIEIIDINNQIQALGENGMNTLDIRAMNLQNYGAEISQAYNLVRGASPLLKNSAEFGRFTAQYQAARKLREFIKENKRDITSAYNQFDTTLTTVHGYKSDVGAAIFAYVPPPDAPETFDNNFNNEENTNNDISALKKAKEQKETETKPKTKEEKTKAKEEQKILTDPEEILKRKIKRGEI